MADHNPPAVPELPEVETTVRLLRPRLVGRRIEDARVQWTRARGGTSVPEFRRSVAGARIAGLERRAKLVVARLSRGRRAAGAVLVHLRMTGRLVHQPKTEPVPEWTRVSLALDRGVLHFLDVRKFGRMTYHEDPAAVLERFGPEPLDESLTAATFARALEGRRRILKPLLLDQEFLAGIGNIYADEALFRSRLHPLRRSDRVGRRGAERLLGAIRATLCEAIEREGSSFDAFYRTPEGQPGRYQESFRVYGREGRPCRRCGARIRKLVVAQRGTHVCPRCQRRPRTTGPRRPW